MTPQPARCEHGTGPDFSGGEDMSGEARSDCTCGERWTLVRFFNVRRAPSRALAELRQRHEDEYQMLLHEHREAELATAEEEWAEHVAEHGLVAANFGRSEIPA